MFSALSTIASVSASISSATMHESLMDDDEEETNDQNETIKLGIPEIEVVNTADVLREQDLNPDDYTIYYDKCGRTKQDEE